MPQITPDEFKAYYEKVLHPLYIMGGGSRLKSPKQFWVGKIESVDGLMVGTMQLQTGSGQEDQSFFC